MFVTFETFQPERSWLNNFVLVNIHLMSVMRSTFHPDESPLETFALLNMLDMFSTLLTSRLDRITREHAIHTLYS